MIITTLAAGLALLAQSPNQNCISNAAYCWEDGEDIILASSEDAAFFMPYLQEARARFETVFGLEAPKAALVFDGIDQSALVEAGYEVILPWLLPNERDIMRREAIENSVRAQTTGLREEQIQAILAQAFEQVGLPQTAPTTLDEVMLAGAAMHELGHLWFREAFDWEMRDGSTRFYGAHNAPDWLDETAAILLENEVIVDGRRQHLGAAWRGESDDEIVSLAHYFSIDHPLLSAVTRSESFLRTLAENSAPDVETARRVMDEPSTETEDGRSVARRQQSAVISLSGEEARELLADADGMDPALFYAQSQGFIDYVANRSGDSRYFVDATYAILAGNTFADWHAMNATRYYLPAENDALQADWEDWLAETYGEPAE